MKKLLFILIGVAFSTNINAQNKITDAYFHELKGMEDSTDTTHLFYRKYVKGQYECTGDNPAGSPSENQNNVYHFDLNSQKDSVLFADYYSEWCLAGSVDSKTVFSYTFYDNNPKKWIISGAYEYAIGISDYSGATLDYNVAIAVKTFKEGSKSNYIPKELILSPSGDSLYVKTFSDITIPFSGNNKEWPVIDEDFEFMAYADSVAIDWNIINIHPKIDSLYFATNSSGDLYRSTHYSSDFTFADSSMYFRNLFFDTDTSHVYSLTSSGVLLSDNLGNQDSWEVSEIDFKTSSSKFLTVDKSVSGNLFVSDSTAILFSQNYGATFTSLLSVDDEITGLYKKPDSDILYVLTRKELLEVNTETKETTTLKQLPVSSEQLTDVPTQISLNQNYPNPFNPSTVISYQLAGNSLVRLEVFDVTGRKVAVLVNGVRKAAGTHEVTFDAENLASGVYFYRLETAGQTLTQKMLLVK
ncbi:T9SS type A sorting domain-containing protein [Gracilimonas sp.]|uniref:T9SS type A sorting domain-containing protein n=1 Tax=Gracilimonas sp. TaxID=1974203 RepID=UPI0032EF5219